MTVKRTAALPPTRRRALAHGSRRRAALACRIGLRGERSRDQGSGQSPRRRERAPDPALGVNRASFEYACAQGWGISEGPTDQAAIAAMTAWRINVVRIPLNEACWLGLSTVRPQYRAAPYRRAVLGYVHRLHSAGLYVILDLQWNALGKQRALKQQPLADAVEAGDGARTHDPQLGKLNPAVAAVFGRFSRLTQSLYSCLLARLRRRSVRSRQKGVSAGFLSRALAASGCPRHHDYEH